MYIQGVCVHTLVSVHSCVYIYFEHCYSMALFLLLNIVFCTFSPIVKELRMAEVVNCACNVASFLVIYNSVTVSFIPTAPFSLLNCTCRINCQEKRVLVKRRWMVLQLLRCFPTCLFKRVMLRNAVNTDYSDFALKTLCWEQR